METHLNGKGKRQIHLIAGNLLLDSKAWFIVISVSSKLVSLPYNILQIKSP